MSSSVSSLSSAGSSAPDESPEFTNKYQILERHQVDYAQRYLDRLFGWQGVGFIIAWYVADGKMMGREEWEFYYGVDIGPETDEIKEALKFSRFYKFYHGPNPVDVMEGQRVRQVCETSLIPTIVPKKVKTTIGIISLDSHNDEIDTDTNLERDFNLQELGKLAEHRKNGHAAKYAYMSDALDQHGTDGIDQADLVILLKGVVARNQPWGRQVQYLEELNNGIEKDLNDDIGYECETKPDALSQNTALMAHHTVTKECPFGTSLGIEGRASAIYSRTIEMVNNVRHVASGCFRDVSHLMAELSVFTPPNDSAQLGVGVLCKCKGKKTRNVGAWI